MISKLVIDRAKWGKGLLLTDDGKMCCLGFLCKAAGLEDDDIIGRGYPKDAGKGLNGGLKEKDINDKLAKIPDRFLGLEEYQGGYAYGPSLEDSAGDVGISAAEINDDDDMPWTEKEYRLKILFKAHGIKLSFKGKR